MVLGKEVFTDAELIGSLMKNAGMDDALRFLYHEHFELLSRYILNNSGNEQDAEDIFQEVVVAFINLVQAGKFRAESSIRTFLFPLIKTFGLMNSGSRRVLAVFFYDIKKLSADYFCDVYAHFLT